MYTVDANGKVSVMAAAGAQVPLNSDAIRNVGRVLPWLARSPGRPDRERFGTANLAGTPDGESRTAVAALERNLRERHDSVHAAISAMTEKLRVEVESAAADTVIDPDGTGVQALEEAEEYFRAECGELRDIRKALDGSGAQSAYGPGVFDELERLDRLFFGIVQCCQEIRWAVMVHDGVASPTTGRMHESGAELVSSLTDS